MPRKLPPTPKLEELKSLSGREQTALAIEIVRDEKDVRALRAALELLRERPAWEAKSALLGRFAALAADGIKRDAGTYLRAAILQALRPLAQPGDLALLEQAAATYEYLPPGRSEEAGLLRSTALVVLSEVDGTLAAYHAVRLLNDPETSPLSGEPALTAVRLLAAQGNHLPLYAYVLSQARFQRPPPPLSEVISECLKGLTGMPRSLLPRVIAQYRDSSDEALLAGLVDLALDLGDQPAAAEFVRRFLADTRQYAVYRYLVARLVTDHDVRFLPDLARLAEREADPRRLAILDETLALGAGDPHVKAVVAALKARKAGRPKEQTHGRTDRTR
jgi:hypothetical protein